MVKNGPKNVPSAIAHLRTRANGGLVCKDFVAKGVNGIWNDMNEPRVFDVALLPNRLQV